jgi:flagellar basal-body rod protein FlgF
MALATGFVWSSRWGASRRSQENRETKSVENALLVGLSRQIALARELDVIANNVANISTNGFKARSARFAEFLSPNASAETFQKPDRRVSFVQDRGTPIDLSGGMIERTGNPLDTAIKGEGFYVVRTAGGERYTRAGSFDINSRGELVTQTGQPVMGENGPIVFGPAESNAQISQDGTVTTAQGERGKLRLVRFANPAALRNEGTNMFSSPTPALPIGPLAKLETGAIERSNVKPIIEMSRLVELQRTYASIAGMISKTDELRRTAIQRLADVQS